MDDLIRDAGSGASGSDLISIDEVRASVREYFAEQPGLVEVRRNRDECDSAAADSDDGVPDRAGFDRDGWSVLAQQLGLIGLVAPESWGGLGLGLAYAVAAVEECGAVLYPGPVRASVLLALALSTIDSDDVPVELQSAVQDFLCGAMIVGAPVRDDEAVLPEFRDGRVSGRAVAVTHGAVAGLVICSVRTQSGPAVALAVPAARPTKVARTSVPTVDLATPLADVVLTDVPAVLLTAPGNQLALQDHQDAAAVLLAAEQVGGAQGCLGQMVDYATVREQFGVLIGTYQAIQHRCAQTAVAVAAARALVASAADALDAGDARVGEQLTLLARADAADAFTAASSSLIQVSGGIGFTWEHDAHLYFRRARASAAIGGTPSELRDRAVESGCLELLLHGAA